VAKTKNFGGEASLMDNQYKLIIPKKGTMELFDIQSDLGEQNNLADTHPEIVKKLKARLLTWQASVEQSLTGADY
jgi:hypothetical protein